MPVKGNLLLFRGLGSTPSIHMAARDPTPSPGSFGLFHTQYTRVRRHTHCTHTLHIHTLTTLTVSNTVYINTSKFEETGRAVIKNGLDRPLAPLSLNSMGLFTS